MSNLVNTDQLPSPQNPWGIQATNFQNSLPKAQVAAPIQAASPKAEVPINVVPSQNSGQFAEHSTHLSVMFSGKLKDMKTKCMSKIMNASTAEAVFKPSTGLAIHNVSAPSTDNGTKVDLSKVIITGMEVTSTFNKFPYPVKFDWTGQGEATNKYDMDGKQAPLMLIPGAQSFGHSTTVFTARDAVNDPILKKWGHVSLNEMWEKIQLINLPNGQKVALVPRDHDALKLIVMNPHRFGPAPSDDDVTLGCYKMSPTVIGAAIDEMYTNILSKFNFHDLTKFKVNMFRADEKDFDDVSNSEWDHLDIADREALSNKTLYAGFDLKITWTFPQQAQQPKPVQVNTVSGPITPSATQSITTTQLTPVNPAFNVFQSNTYSASKIPVAVPRGTN